MRHAGTRGRLVGAAIVVLVWTFGAKGPASAQTMDIYWVDVEGGGATLISANCCSVKSASAVWCADWYVEKMMRGSVESPSGPTPNRPSCRRRPRSTPSARSRCAPSCAATAGGSCGTSTSPATTTSATRPWSAPRCATPCTRATARRWPCSASRPPPGRSPRATASSAGRGDTARRTCRWSSTRRFRLCADKLQ